MKRWIGVPSVLLLLAGLSTSAWANSELHDGGRLFFPLWDVSTPNRLTYIIVTRQAMREGASSVSTGSTWQVSGDPGKCLPRGQDGSTTNVNRTDLDGTAANPVFVDDVHFEYYGRSCASANEIVHMSCGDTDLFVLANPENETIKPRFAFANVAGDRRGALDVHLITNTLLNRRERKLENSLMGEAIIVDLAEGWVAGYAAASAKAVPCSTCADIDGGTPVGYENYPMEVYLPFALADGTRTSGGALTNLLSLWAPPLLPGDPLFGAAFLVVGHWYDGRERPYQFDVSAHSLIRYLGTVTDGADTAIDIRFNVANFTCGHTVVASQAENDGFPRDGTDATACGGPDVADSTHKSDNFENLDDLNFSGHTIQPSTPIGWWRFTLAADTTPPPLPPGEDPNFNHSGRGLVGVVLSASPGRTVKSPPRGDPPRVIHHFSGVARATRLWHEDPCEIAQSGDTIGPPHDRDRLIFKAFVDEDYVALFNALNFDGEELLCVIGTE